MECNSDDYSKMKMCRQSIGTEGRNPDPEDISVIPGYRIEVFMQGLDAPSCMCFNEGGDLLIAESGYITGTPKLIRFKNGDFDILAEDFQAPLTGITFNEGNIYVSHKGMISVVRTDGRIETIIAGLPSNGDYVNSNIIFGQDQKLYFGQGTVTNSGVVGQDNTWLFNHPLAHDYPGTYILVNGQNFETENILIASRERIVTGAYSPFGVANIPYEIKKGVVKATGSILRANPDGSDLELVAWGLRNPSKIKFDEEGRLYAANHGFDLRGSRPIANAPDDFYEISPDTWYGWPDFTGGEPVTLPRFRPEGEPQPEFLLTNHPNIPPRPLAVFPPNTNIMGFDFNYDEAFGSYGSVYIAEFGPGSILSFQQVIPYAGIGHRISVINMNTGGVSTFAINKSGFPSYITGEGGFGRPIDVVFGPDKALYVLDMGVNVRGDPYTYLPNSGVIWKITAE